MRRDSMEEGVLMISNGSRVKLKRERYFPPKVLPPQSRYGGDVSLGGSLWGFYLFVPISDTAICFQRTAPCITCRPRATLCHFVRTGLKEGVMFGGRALGSMAGTLIWDDGHVGFSLSGGGGGVNRVSPKLGGGGSGKGLN